MIYPRIKHMQTLIYAKIEFLIRKGLFKLTFLFSIVFGAQLGLAQKQADSTSELDILLSKYNGLGDFSAGFAQIKKLVALGMELKGRGQLKVFEDKSVIWEILEPAPMNIRIDSKEIVITTKVSGKEQKQVFSLTEGIAGNQIAMSVKPFLDLFSGSSSALHERFAITKSGLGYSLTPKDQMPIKTLELIPDSSGTYVEQVLIHEKSGDSIAYLFTKPKSLAKK